MGTTGITSPKKTAGPNVKPIAAQISANSAQSQDTQSFQLVSQALYLVQTNLDTITSTISQLSGGSSSTIVTTTATSADVTSVTASEPPNQRYLDTSAIMHTAIAVNPVVSNTTFPVTVTIWFDFDDGNGWVWQGPFDIIGSGATIIIGQGTQQQPGNILVPTNLSQTNWKVAAAGETGQTEQPPADAMTATFTVVAADLCPQTDVTNAGFITNPAGNILQYALTDPGVWVWNYYEIDWQQPIFSADPYFWFSIITVQKGYSISVTGTVSGGVNLTVSSGSIPAPVSGQAPYDVHANGGLSEMATWISTTSITLATAVTNGTGTFNIWIPSPVTATDIEGEDQEPLIMRGRPIADSRALTGSTGPNGATVQLKGTIPPNWTFPPVLNIDGSTNLYRTFRFRIYAASILGQETTGNLNIFTLQTCWSGGADYSEVTPAAQPSALNLGLSNPTFFHSTDFTITGGVFTINNVDMSKAINLSAQFAISGGLTTITNLSANLIITGELQVGGGSNRISQMKIFDTTFPTPLLIGFIGDDSGGSGYVGAWFKRCGVGGTGPLTPNFFADVNGNVVCTTVFVKDSVGPGGFGYGFMGTVGGITGIWAQNGYFGGTTPGTALVTITGTTGAITGTSLSLASGSFTASIDSSNGVSVNNTTLSSIVKLVNGHVDVTKNISFGSGSALGVYSGETFSIEDSSGTGWSVFCVVNATGLPHVPVLTLTDSSGFNSSIGARGFTSGGSSGITGSFVDNGGFTHNVIGGIIVS